MKIAILPDVDGEDLHMGSEYSTARNYLAQKPRDTTPLTGRRKTGKEPQHGSNDSDFGIADQAAE